MRKSKDKFLPLKSACCYEKGEMKNEQAKTTYSVVIPPTLSINYMSHIGLHRAGYMGRRNSLKHLCVIP